MRGALAGRDAADPITGRRRLFTLPEGVIYLDGNSLGALPVAAARRLREAIDDEWGVGLIGSWNTAGWVDLPLRVGERIGALIGAEPGTVVAGDSTTVNLFKVAAAAASLRRGRGLIVSDTGNFPTDLYVLAEVASRSGMELELVEPERVGDALCEDTAVLALTEVDYRTGRRHDMARLTAAAHAAGALAVWDLAHSAGAMPVRLAESGADFAVGCGYKYLNGGPGAPGFLYVAPAHLAEFANPITGWFGHARPFDFDLVFDPADGIARGMVGTPAVLSMTALEGALTVFEGVDMEELRASSLELTGLFIDLIDEKVPAVEVVTPRRGEERGSQVSLRHPEAHSIVQACIARSVVGDFRTPDIARFGFTPLYVTRLDVWHAVEVIADILATDAHRDPRFATRRPVT